MKCISPTREEQGSSSAFNVFFVFFNESTKLVHYRFTHHLQSSALSRKQVHTMVTQTVTMQRITSTSIMKPYTQQILQAQKDVKIKYLGEKKKSKNKNPDRGSEGVFNTHTHTDTHHTYKAYISMKMEPNGRIPPRQTMTAGSMNLGDHNIAVSFSTLILLKCNAKMNEISHESTWPEMLQILFAYAWLPFNQINQSIYQKHLPFPLNQCLPMLSYEARYFFEVE